MSTIFRGVFVESLGGFLVVRGFAKLSDLAKHSFAENYQRGIKPDHQAAIQTFYERGEYLFFPEVILSLELLADYEKSGAPAADPLQLIRQGQSFKSNINGVSIKATRTKTAADLTRINITLPDAAGPVLISVLTATTASVPLRP